MKWHPQRRRASWFGRLTRWSPRPRPWCFTAPPTAAIGAEPRRVWSGFATDPPSTFRMCLGLWAYYNCDSSSIRVRLERDSSTIRARHATTRYEVFRALAYEIDSSTPRESVVGVSCMLIDSSVHTAFTVYLYRPTLHRVCEYARNCLYKRN